MRTAESVGPVTTRQTTTSVSAGGTGLFAFLWLAFLAALIFDPERLDTIWLWFRELPVIGQAVGWLLLLPLVVGLVIWQAPWAPWIRVTLIVLVALANAIAFAPKSSPE
jgi:hypothetical protein